MPNILLVDDDTHIRQVVRFALEKAEFRVLEASDGSAALASFANHSVDLVVLDILMPEMDGLEVCRRLRRNSNVPILFLSSRTEELDRIIGLELGADDYVVKPFSPRELVARVRSILRRARFNKAACEDRPSQRVALGNLELDVVRHHCSWDGQPVVLTVTEFGLLYSLFGMPGKVYARDELVERAYGAGHHITDRTVDSHIRRIRKKFREQGGDPVETVHGLGYRLRECSVADVGGWAPRVLT